MQVARAVLARIEEGSLSLSDEVGSSVQLSGGRVKSIGGETAGWGCCAGLRASGAHVWWPHEVADDGMS